MIVTLEHSQSFQQEFSQYRNRCNALGESAKKTEIQSLIKSLFFQVQKLDEQHASLIENKRMPEFVSECRQTILSIRKSIVKQLADAEKH